MKSKQLTVWEAACIITGYGVGGGGWPCPTWTARNGLAVSLLILLAALLAQLCAAQHDRRDDTEKRRGRTDQRRLSKYLFTEMEKGLTLAFFLL